MRTSKNAKNEFDGEELNQNPLGQSILTFLNNFEAVMIFKGIKVG